jgi:hypothetical protein
MIDLLNLLPYLLSPSFSQTSKCFEKCKNVFPANISYFWRAFEENTKLRQMIPCLETYLSNKPHSIKMLLYRVTVRSISDEWISPSKQNTKARRCGSSPCKGTLCCAILRREHCDIQKKDRRSRFDRSEGRNLEDSKCSIREYRNSNLSTRCPLDSEIIRIGSFKNVRIGETASFDSHSIEIWDYWGGSLGSVTGRKRNAQVEASDIMIGLHRKQPCC